MKDTLNIKASNFSPHFFRDTSYRYTCTDVASEEDEKKRAGKRLVDHARSKCKCALRVMANVSNVCAVLRRRPPDGVRARGPTRTGPQHNFHAYNYRWSAVTEARRGAARRSAMRCGSRSVFRWNPIASGRATTGRWRGRDGGEGGGEQADRASLTVIIYRWRLI